MATTGWGNPDEVYQGSTTAGQNGPLIQGAVSSSAPSYTTGTTQPLSLTTSGALRVGLTISSIEIGTVDQGSPNTVANAWPIKLTDGVDTATVNTDGSINVANVTSVIATTATITSISSSTSSQTVLASNGNRKGFLLFNDSTQSCYVSFASTSSTSTFTMLLISGMTYQNEAIIYTGVISAIWSSANGALRVTELTG